MKVPEEILTTIENARTTGQVYSFEYKKAVLDRFLWQEWGSFACGLIYNKRIRLRDEDEAGISALYDEFKEIIEDKEILEGINMELDWGKQERSVTLTNTQWNRLTAYLLMTTTFRQGELETWEKLAEEKMPDGTPEFPNAPGQVDFWKGMIADIAGIRETIDNRLMGVVEDKEQVEDVVTRRELVNEIFAEFESFLAENKVGQYSPHGNYMGHCVSLGLFRDRFAELKAKYISEDSLDLRLADAIDRSSAVKDSNRQKDIEFG